MHKTALSRTDFAQLCSSLYELAQRHVPGAAVSDVTELVQIAKILREADVPLTLSSKLSAHADDYSPNVVKQSAEYRLLRARYAAALGTIADMGSKKVRKTKSEFHAGINEGLRRAAEIAIMFLEDLDANIYQQHTYHDAEHESEAPKAKPRSSIVR